MAFLVIAGGLAIFLVFYVFATFIYRTSRDVLYLQHWILKFMPVRCHEIEIKNIKEVRRFDVEKDLLRGAAIFGNFFRNKGVMVLLKESTLWGKRIYVSPENPERFIKRMNNLIKRKETENESGIVRHA